MAHLNTILGQMLQLVPRHVSTISSIPIPGQARSPEHFRIGHSLSPCCTLNSVLAKASGIMRHPDRSLRYMTSKLAKQYNSIQVISLSLTVVTLIMPGCISNLDCFDRLFAAYLFKIQKHHKYRHVGIDPACSHHVNGAA